MSIFHLLRPIIFCVDAEKAHSLTQKLLRLFGQKSAAPCVNPVKLFGLSFPNRIGLAAGWDKNGECIDALFGLGFGFVEVGTVTPRPQEGNPKPRLFRITAAQAIINRMGFNNKGVDYLVEQLKKRNVPGIVGVNIGKNKDTPNATAHEDYIYCMQKVYAYADYITINISSPNTPGLRDLHAKENLDELLGRLDKARDDLMRLQQRCVPILIKLSPDFPHQELEDFINISLKHNINGIIATNTSISRDAVAGLPHAGEAGGLSGKPIAERSTKTIAEIKKIAANMPIIGVGGIDSPASAEEKLSAGADLIQVYTGMIYQGPGLIRLLIKNQQFLEGDALS